MDYGDPCRWGIAPTNGTLTPHGTPAPSAASNNIFPEIIPSNWVPGQHSTLAPSPPHGGWEPIAGIYKIVYLPGVLAMIALFVVNTVDSRDLNEEYTETAVGAVPGALKMWLFGGMVLGMVSVLIAIWSYVDNWTRHVDIKDRPVC